MMFSPQVKREFNSSVANHKFSDVRAICEQLNEEANQDSLFDHPSAWIIDNVNNFVESFAFNYGLTAHTVRPLVWRFNIDDTHAFEDGLIELRFNKEDQPSFVYIDVSDSKITDPDSAGHIVDLNEHAVRRLSAQLDDWEKQLHQFEDESKSKLSTMIAELDTKLSKIKANTSDLTNDAIRECKMLWQKFEIEMLRLRK